MSVDHNQRLTGVVKAALKEAALGATDYGYAVNGPLFAPVVDQAGNPVGLNPSWLVLITLRAGLGGEQITAPGLIPGVLPSDQAFKETAQKCLENARQQREQLNAQAMQQASMEQFVKGQKEAA